MGGSEGYGNINHKIEVGGVEKSNLKCQGEQVKNSYGEKYTRWKLDFQYSIFNCTFQEKHGNVCVDDKPNICTNRNSLQIINHLYLKTKNWQEGMED